MNKSLKPKIDLNKLKSGLTWPEIQKIKVELLETVSVHHINKDGGPFFSITQREDAESYSQFDLEKIWQWLVTNDLKKLDLSKISLPMSKETKNAHKDLTRYGLHFIATENRTKITWIMIIPEMYSKNELNEIAIWYDREIWHNWD